MLLAIIPARGGSKGIPRKNLALLDGKPLLQYSIEAARSSIAVDEILLSTDDEEIAELGLSCGLNLSYRRPIELAQDDTSMIDTLEHALRWFESASGRLPTDLMLLQPTSPLRLSSDIDGAANLLHSSGALSVVSVHAMREHPCDCIVKNEEGWEYLVEPPTKAVRRQDYPSGHYFINGAIYLSGAETFLRHRSFIHRPGTEFYEIPRKRGTDIDYPIDIMVAESSLRME